MLSSPRHAALPARLSLRYSQCSAAKCRSGVASLCQADRFGRACERALPSPSPAAVGQAGSQAREESFSHPSLRVKVRARARRWALCSETSQDEGVRPSVFASASRSVLCSWADARCAGMWCPNGLCSPASRFLLLLAVLCAGSGSSRAMYLCWGRAPACSFVFLFCEVRVRCLRLRLVQLYVCSRANCDHELLRSHAFASRLLSHAVSDVHFR